MDAHSASHGPDDAHHPTPWMYVKIGVVLFVLTFFEVAAYEVGHRPGAILHSFVEPIVVPLLLALSAAKFALVAMFYMHLKQDSKVFTNLFVWPIGLAAGLIVALIVLARLWHLASF